MLLQISGYIQLLRMAKRFDIVLLINGLPVAIGELKTPVRNAISWLDGAQDISDYEKSVPEMFVPNVFNFASEGKCYRYGSVNMPLTKMGDLGTLLTIKQKVALLM